MREQVPDDLVDRAIMPIDQKRLSVVVGLLLVACQMDFLDVRQRISVDVGKGILLLVGRCDMDIVDVEKQAAPRASHHFGDEVDLRKCAFGEGEIGRRIFQQHLPAQEALDLTFLPSPAAVALLVREEPVNERTSFCTTADYR